MNKQNIARGFVCTPLFTCLLLIGYLMVRNIVENEFLPNDSWATYGIALLFGIFFTYAGATLIGLPFLYLFRYCKFNNFVSSLLAGFFTGTAISILLFLWLGSGTVINAMPGILLYSLMGTLSGLVFWWFAFTELTMNPFNRICTCLHFQ
jgi:uncharacterized membrane protein YesL